MRLFINERTIEIYSDRVGSRRREIGKRSGQALERRQAAETEAAGVEAVAEAGKLFIERNSRARGVIRTGELLYGSWNGHGHYLQKGGGGSG